MPFEGVCPYWKGESIDRKKMECEMCIFEFQSKEERRRLAFGYCAKDYEGCTIYKVLSAREE